MNCAVITVDDTLSFRADSDGRVVKDLLQEAGHFIQFYQIVNSNRSDIKAAIRTATSDVSVRMVILTGGTGVQRRDVTPEAVDRLVYRRLHGFGEAFRRLYYEEVGPPAIFSRAMAGITLRGVYVFALPKSRSAVELGIRKLILPQLPLLPWNEPRE